MMQSFVLGAYWDARSDSLEDCVDRVERFFAGLGEVDPLLSHWYERGRSRKDALASKVDTSDAQKLQELLLKGRNRRDVDRGVIEELGFRLGLWNGANVEEAEALVSIKCGSYTERVSNNVLVDLPYLSESLPWVEKASSLLALVAQIWCPQWAGIMSKKAMRERDFGGGRPFVDWMIYVPRSVESVLPPGRVETLNGLGSIIIVQPAPPVGDGVEELSRIRQVEDLLAA